MILRERRLDIAGLDIVRTKIGRKLMTGIRDMKVLGGEMSMKSKRMIGGVLMRMIGERTERGIGEKERSIEVGMKMVTGGGQLEKMMMVDVWLKMIC